MSRDDLVQIASSLRDNLEDCLSMQGGDGEVVVGIV